MTTSILPSRSPCANPTAGASPGCAQPHTRRALLAGVAAAPALALPAAVVAADPLPPLGREFFALDERFHELDRAGRERWGLLLREIAHTPAATLAGLAVKAAAVRRELRGGTSWHYLPLADGLVDGAERQAGEARHG